MVRATEVTHLQEENESTPASTAPRKFNDGDLDIKSKYITTAVIYYCNIVLGICATFLAPALIDFRNKYDTDTLTISLVFTISMACALVSAIAFGVIFNYVNRHALITFLMALMSFLIIILPFSPSLILFFILNALIAMATGGYLTAQIVWIIELWDGKGPYIQGQHFAFSLGCIFPPLIFAPFLSNAKSHHGPFEVTSNMTSMSSLEDPNDLTHFANSTLYKMENPEEVIVQSNVIIPCAIVGVITAIGAILLLLILCCLPRPPKNRRSSMSTEMSKGDQYSVVTYNKDGSKAEAAIIVAEEEPIREKKKVTIDSSLQERENGIEEEEEAGNSKVWLRLFLIVIAAAFVGSFSSMESSTGHFLQVFAHYTKVQFSEAEGAQLLFGYNMAYTAGRLVGIIITSFNSISPQILLVGNLSLAALGNLVLLVWGGDLVHWMWIGTVLIGIGCSTGVPSVFAYVQNYLEITNVVGSILMVSGGALAAVYPLIVGKFIDEVPGVLMYTNFCSIALGVVAFVTIMCFTRKRRGGKL